jgi:arabinose-5-phosphate isomerase
LYVEATRQKSPKRPDQTGQHGVERGLERVVENARATFIEQAESIARLAGRVDASFGRALGLLLATPGHVVVSGMGKSGHISRKIAATFSSTGTPSFFLHPAEAVHGDLGMLTERDTVVLVSYSGETEEIVRILPHLARIGTPIIALVGNLHSTLARAATAVLDVSVEREVCPNNLAPTNSTLAALAMGDALAVSLIDARKFKAEDFARFHPAGSLGRRLLTRVCDVMHKGSLPLVSPSQSVRDSLFTITRGRLGLALVMEGDRLVGIVTDGDLRRAMQRDESVFELPVSSVMNGSPITIGEDAMLSDAEVMMRRKKVKALVAVNGRGSVTGVVEIFDR